MAPQDLTFTQRNVLGLLRSHPTISYCDIAAELALDVQVAFTAVRGLELKGRITKQKGNGRTPNRYQILEG